MFTNHEGNKIDGVHDFTNFSDYANQWLIPCIVADLHTIFEGARQSWISQTRENPTLSDGRGDFLLTSSLMAIFDHVGSFMARESESLDTAENIGRIARALKSTRDAADTVATLGRHEFIHAAWQNLPVPIFDGLPNPLFRLAFGARPDETDHRTFIVDRSGPRDVIATGGGVFVVKYILNLHVLRNEFVTLLSRFAKKQEIPPEQYMRVVKFRSVVGLPAPLRNDKITGGGTSPHEPNTGKRKYAKWEMVRWQMRRLNEEAEALGAFDNLGKEFKRRS